MKFYSFQRHTIIIQYLYALPIDYHCLVAVCHHEVDPVHILPTLQLSFPQYVYIRTHMDKEAITCVMSNYLSNDGYLEGCFHMLAIVSNAAVNVGVHIFFSFCFHFCQRNTQKQNCWMTQQTIVNLGGNSLLFSIVSASISFPPIVHKGCFFPASSPTLVVSYITPYFKLTLYYVR